MKNSKDIDSIFRERFRNARVQPPADAWDNILSGLPEKEEKKRIFPLWLPLAGAAAALALIFGLPIDKIDEEENSQVSTFTYKSGKIGDKIDKASEAFTIKMHSSGLFLESLVYDSGAEEIQQEQQETRVSQNYFADIIKVPGDFEVLRESYDFSDFSNLPQEQELAITEQEKNELPGIPEEEVELAVVENKVHEKRFSVTTKVAPVFFDNFGSGNPIDKNFDKNQSKGEVSIAFGINLAYQLSEKVKIRSGVSKVDLAYHTSEVSYNEFMSTAAKKVDERMSTTLASPVRGELNQSLGFIEVPLEMEYRLLDKRVGVNLIGGASALFLEQNEISLNSSTFSSDFGEAQNLNKMSFSTNVGVGFDYEISKDIELSLEPVLKLQLNTFRDVQGLKPYYFGIYSGLSYKF